MDLRRLNNYLYSTKERAYAILRVSAYIFSFIGVMLVIYAFGFNAQGLDLKTVFRMLDVVFAAFAINYLVRILYSFQRLKFIKRTWFEGSLNIFILLNGLIFYLFGVHVFQQTINSVDLESTVALYKILVTLFMLVLVILEVVKLNTRLTKLKLKPATSFIFSFVILILLGTGALCLPAMTKGPGSMDFLDALFTATSASCVTGLIVVDTATYFTLKGQLVLLFLIQLGGIGMISFATFFATFMQKGVGLKHQLLIKDQLNADNLLSSSGLLRQIIFTTISIEAIGAVCVFFTWGRDVVFNSLLQKIYFSVFHSISAFCNAGFSLYSNGLYEHPIRQSYILHLALAGLIILGSIGFPVIQDLTNPKILRRRLQAPWMDWKLGTQIVVYVSATLIVAGSVLIYFLEDGNTLQGMNRTEAIITAFFQSVTTRTAGFNTVDIGALSVPTLVIMIGLMFIGASPGSTGGGIKTTTFWLIMMSAVATIRSQRNVQISRRSIPNELIFKAFFIFTFAASFNILAIFVLTIFEKDIDILKLAFEQISAFATVGLSTGITAQLSEPSRILIILSMFVGRLGPLTVALALSRKVSTNNYKYPKGTVIVG